MEMAQISGKVLLAVLLKGDFWEMAQHLGIGVFSLVQEVDRGLMLAQH